MTPSFAPECFEPGEPRPIESLSEKTVEAIESHPTLYRTDRAEGRAAWLRSVEARRAARAA